MAEIVVGRFEGLEMLEGAFEAIKLNNSILIFGRCTTRVFQCLANLSYEVCEVCNKYSMMEA